MSLTDTNIKFYQEVDKNLQNKLIAKEYDQNPSLIYIKNKLSYVKDRYSLWKNFLNNIPQGKEISTLEKISECLQKSWNN